MKKGCFFSEKPANPGNGCYSEAGAAVGSIVEIFDRRFRCYNAPESFLRCRARLTMKE
jgi:hypothetical protein